ncbi:hypothetical protein X798_02275 [Onchocerca flexuosa]|uniref:Uncharacterized protein n=1 Tax=Onchocerca flexuosa TaxID=387005 RepID=A0A238C036_9BILA|nr:hypothetical protein X798_02275 [Onchocerca flexuosa]
MNAKLEALSETIEDFGNKAIMENESRATEMENFGAEKHDVRAGLVCAEQLSIRQMDFENRLRNLEKQYNKLACPTLEQPRVYGREETRRPEIDYSDMVEWPPRHWSSSGSKKVEESRVNIKEETRRPEIDYSDMVEWPPRHWSSSGSKEVEDDEKKNPDQHKATIETAEERNKVAAYEQKTKSPQKFSPTKFPKCHPS